MTIYSIRFPRLPRGVSVDALADNLKLYSEQEIQAFKLQFTEDGRHRYYVDESGIKHKLKYPVYVFHGKIFAVYPGNKFLLADGDSSFARCKLAQDLESGEWLVDKTIPVDSSLNDTVTEDVRYEQSCLSMNHQDVLAGDQQPVSFYRPFNDAVVREGVHEEDGKYDLFMQYAYGMDLQEWLHTHARLPLIVRMHMSLGLINALQLVHANGTLHRDVKCRNAVYDMQKPAHESVTLVDFGLSVAMDELHDELSAGWGTPGYMAPEICYSEENKTGLYSIKSDIYALGVTLGKVWGLIDVDGSGVMSFSDGASFTGDFALKRCLLKLLRDMTAVDPEARPSLDVLQFEFGKLCALLPEQFCVVKTAFIDLQDVKDASMRGEAAWDHLLARLSGYDQVQLFDVSGREPRCDVRSFLRLKQALVNGGLIVKDKLYQGTRAEMEAYVEAADKVQHQESRVIDRISLVSMQEKKQQQRVAMVEAREPAPEVESYDWRDCFSWFFGSLAEDAAHISRDLMRPAVDECGVGCLGMFSRRSDIAEVERLTNPLYETLSDSDEESDNDRLAMGRY